MKRFFTTKTMNRTAIFFLLAASIIYHLLQVLKAKDGSMFSAGVGFSSKTVQSSILPSGTNPLFLLTQ